MHGSIGCRASSAIYLGLYFHCASHDEACTHIPFKKFAIALAIGFSSESLLKYERFETKKKLVGVFGCLFLSVFYFIFIERQFFC